MLEASVFVYILILPLNNCPRGVEKPGELNKNIEGLKFQFTRKGNGKKLSSELNLSPRKKRRLC